MAPICYKQIAGSGGITVTYRANWLIDKKKVAIAFKTLIKEKMDPHFKDFIDLANKWAGVQSDSVVKLYGITLMSPTALVMEYLEYGPLNAFLREKHKKLKLVQLIMAGNGLARALLDLSEAGFVHGRLRASKVLVQDCGHNKLVVKLSDPGLHLYTEQDIHWIPVEYHSDMHLARRSTTADVWAFGTTLWEIFSYGKSPVDCNPQLRPMAYVNGERLEWPDHCPRDTWLVIISCWELNPHRRATSQRIMRDIWYLLSRETKNASREYQTPVALAEVKEDDEPAPFGDVFPDEHPDDNTSMTSADTVQTTLSLPSTRFIPNIPYGSDMPDAHRMQWIFGVGPECEVTIENNIGTGHYGEVYKGILERKDNARPPQIVAVKKLKEKRIEDGEEERRKRREFLEDFEKEINVMKSLVHPNIVKIIGVCSESEVMIVMPYLEHGALNSYLNIYKHSTSTAQLLKYAKDVASGMEYLSSKKVVHRDLAARNILVKDPCNVQISDFGLARFTSNDDTYRMINNNRELPLSWHSPEAATQGVFSSKGDVWSYGVTVWEMFGYCSQTVVPFDLTQPENRAECFPIPTDCDADVYTRLMRPCWTFEPAERPAFIELVLVCEQLSMRIGSV